MKASQGQLLISQRKSAPVMTINAKVLKQQKVRFKKLSASIIKPIATPAQLLLGLDTAKITVYPKVGLVPASYQVIRSMR
jgi:hypothetical protein